MKIRLFTPSDVSQLAAIFEASVMQGSGEFYSFAERSAWAYIEGEIRSEHYWLERLKGTTIWVAEADNMLVGFINLKIGRSVPTVMLKPLPKWNVCSCIPNMPVLGWPPLCILRCLKKLKF